MRPKPPIGGVPANFARHGAKSQPSLCSFLHWSAINEGISGAFECPEDSLRGLAGSEGKIVGEWEPEGRRE